MRTFIEYAIRSHLHLASFCFIYVFGLYSINTNAWIYALMLSLGILGIYNAHRLWKDYTNDLPDYILDWLSTNRFSVIIISTCSSAGALFLYLSFFWQYRGIHMLTGFAVTLSFFYVYRLRRYNLREIPYLKIFLVFLIWFFLLHYLPFLIFGKLVYPINGALLLFAILIPSDMKDVSFDPLHMRTIPQVIGIKRSLLLLRTLVSLGVLNALIVPSLHTKAWLIGFIYLFGLTFFYQRINARYYFSWIDLGFFIVGVAIILT